MVETDAVEVYKEFSSFTTKEMKKSLTQAVKNCGSELVRETKKSLRKSVKNSNKVNPKYNDSLQQGIRRGKVKENSRDGIYLYVLITSKNTTGSGSFRLHILENGSFRKGRRYATYWRGERLRKPRYTGVLKATYFFKSAVNNYKAGYDNKMNTAINKSIEKINNKKFGK